MAIKGNGYLKTSWSFAERPVASAKLNTWDDRMEAALELIHFLLSQTWGGGDGVLRGATTDDLKAVATAPEGLSVLVQPGYAFISNFPYTLATALQTVDVVAPSVDPRLDLVQARLGTWDVSVKQGTEAASPVAPIADADAIPIAHLYLRVGMASIKDADDATNGYIIDVRNYL
ncbi:MAG: hypothetical protein IID08_07810 [Candidatus Hydrogenedentes bacterium]|nr:hypothetical protein [Candidatus Hydrogenedentota bacterium]